MKDLQVSIGIPTHEAGKSLSLVIDSIVKQTAWKHIKEIIVLIDGKKPNSEIIRSIKMPKVKIIFYPQQKGQSQRINDITKIATGELLVLTNDDVYLKNDSIENFLDLYKTYKADLYAGVPLPFTPSIFLEKILNTGQKINQKIISNWNNGDNYLAVNGRLIALSKRYYKKLLIPRGLHNNDAYIYINAIVNENNFMRAMNSVAYYKTPSSLNEHFNQSVKFGISKKENQSYFEINISKFYNLPKYLALKSFLNVLITDPMPTLLYMCILYISRAKSYLKNSFKLREGIWKTDHTTKDINTLINLL